MNKAICHYSFHRRWDAEKWDCNRLAAEVRALGVEGVDFHVRYLGEPKGAAKRIKAAVKKHGLKLSGLSMSNNFNQADPAELRAQVDAVKRWLPVAAEAGAGVSRVFGGHLTPEDRRDEGKKAEGRRRILDALGQVVGEAERLGVVLALENHGGLPCTGQEQVSVIEEIGSPNLRATIDVGNYMQGGQEAQEGTRLAAGHCAYVHFKDFKKIPGGANPWGWDIEAATVGYGDVDLAACVKVLREAGYDGFVALEYEGKEDESVGVPRSVETMKRVM